MGTPSGSPLWLGKTRALRRYLKRWPSDAKKLYKRFPQGLVLDALAWLELYKLAACDKSNRWHLTPLGLESMDWIAVPNHAQPPEARFSIAALVDQITEKYCVSHAELLAPTTTIGRGVPARDELFWQLRGRGLSVSQIAVRMGFDSERVANAIGRHSMRVTRSYA